MFTHISMNILQSILSSDTDAVKQQINDLKEIKSASSKKMIAVLEAALSLKEQLNDHSSDDIKNRLLHTILAHPWLATEKMKRKLNQGNNAKQAITEENIQAVISAIITDMDDERILNENSMLKIQNAIKKILGVKKLHTKTIYTLVWEDNPYDKELHRDHVYFCALLRDMEYKWEKGSSQYNKINHFVKNFKSYDKRIAGPKIIWKIDLPVKQVATVDPIKQAKTTDPLSIVWENKTSREFLQCYNLDTIEKIQESYKEWKNFPARIVNIAWKSVFLTIGQENLGWWNTRLFNLSIPFAAFKGDNKPKVGDIHPVKIARVAIHKSRPWEWFIQGELQDADMLTKKPPVSNKSTLADVMPEGLLAMSSDN